jgi:hypothetical protein
MDHAPSPQEPREGGEVVDFGDAVLQACPAEERIEVMTEAAMVAKAFAPQGRPAQIEALAQELRTGAREHWRGRRRLLSLAAALRRLARRAGA